jgi:hypothetical protein
MEKKQERKYSMYNAVNNFLLETDPVIISKMPNMDVSMQDLQKNIEQIQEISENQQQNRSGYRVSKQITKEEMVDIVYVLAGQVRSLAVNTNNVILRNEVTYNISDLKAMADGNLQVNAGIIIEKAEENIADLADYGVTPASLQNINDLLTEFGNKLAQPRNAITNKAEETQLLKEMFTKTDLLLDDTMDTLVIIVKLTDNQFYNIYNNNRKIIGPGYSTLALRVFVTNELQEPLSKVKAIIHGFTKVYRTTEKGSFQVKSLPEGMHTITFSLPGYKDQTIAFPIIKGKRTDLRIVLQALEVAI